MTPTEGMRISFPALVGWVLGVGALLGGVGAYPTFRVAGGEGLKAEAVAAVTVMAVMVVSAGFVRLRAPAGPGKAAMAFLYSCAVRVVACLGLVAGFWALLDLPARVLFLWTCVFYVCMLGVEGAWLARALGRDAHLEALGEIRNPARGLPRRDGDEYGEKPVAAGQHKSD